jgi:hypothetical protein
MLPPPRCRELAHTRRLSRTRWWSRTRRPARSQWMAREQRGGRQQASTLWLTRSAAGLHPASFTRSMTGSYSTAPLRFPSVSSGLPQPPCVGHAGLSALWLARSMAGLHPASFPRSMTGSRSGSRQITFNNEARTSCWASEESHDDGKQVVRHSKTQPGLRETPKVLGTNLQTPLDDSQPSQPGLREPPKVLGTWPVTPPPHVVVGTIVKANPAGRSITLDTRAVVGSTVDAVTVSSAVTLPTRAVPGTMVENTRCPEELGDPG